MALFATRPPSRLASRTLTALALLVGLAGTTAGQPLYGQALAPALATGLVAQDSKVVDTRQPGDRQGGPSAADLRLSLEFEGGTVAEYVQRVSEPIVNMLHVNAVINPAARDIRLSPVQIKDLTLERCFELIPQLRVNSADPEPTVSVDREATGPGSLLLRVDAMVDAATIDTQVMAFAVGRLLAGQNPDEARKQFEAAIEATLRMLDERQPRRPSVRASVSLHPESGTVLVLGTEDQLRAIRDLFTQMGLEREANNAQEEAHRQAEAERMYARGLARIDVDRASAQVEYEQKRTEEIGQAVEAGKLPTSVLAEQRLRLKLAELDLDKAKAWLESIERGGHVPAKASPARAIDLSRADLVRRDPVTSEVFAGGRDMVNVPSPARALPPDAEASLRAQLKRQEATSPAPDLERQMSELEQQVRASQAQIALLTEELEKSRTMIESLQAKLAGRPPQ